MLRLKVLFYSLNFLRKLILVHSFIILFLLFMFLYIRGRVVYLLWPVTGLNLSTYLCIRFNFYSCFFLSVVCCISLRVFNFCKYYISGDLYESRFTKIFFVFVLSMLIFIISPDIFFKILWWDMLGISSYLLVCHYQSLYSLTCGTLTILTNRLGDRGMIISICLMMPFTCIVSRHDLGLRNYFAFFLILSSFVKRAQIPFSLWLPAAIAAPTPVSSLVHSSTLVTAGIYLVIESYTHFSIHHRNFILFISLFTIFLSSFRAFLESNLKKVIALSTVSQMSVMLIFIRINIVNICFFHIIIHALFKSTLFITSGIVLHSIINSLDRRTINLNWKCSPLILIGFIVGNICLIGLPFFSGFFSKDLSFEICLSYRLSTLVTSIFLLSIFFTGLYSIKLISFFRRKVVQRIPFLLFRNFRFVVLLRFIPMCLLVVSSGFLYLDFLYFESFFSSIGFFLKFYILIIILFVVLCVPSFWNFQSKNLIILFFDFFFISRSAIFFLRKLNNLKKLNFLDKGVYDTYIGSGIFSWFSDVSAIYIHYYKISFSSVSIFVLFCFCYYWEGLSICVT